MVIDLYVSTPVAFYWHNILQQNDNLEVLAELLVHWTLKFLKQ